MKIGCAGSSGACVSLCDEYQRLAELIAAAKFSHNFSSGVPGCDTITSSPIDPVPRVLVDPAFHADTNTLDLTLSEFYFPEPLDVYLGPIGPLRVAAWQSTARAEKSLPPVEQPATPLDDVAKSGRALMSAFPSTVQHVLVVVDMPGPEEIIRTMQDSVVKAAQAGEDERGMQVDTAPWLEAMMDGDHLDAGELTIQAALRNAERASENDFERRGDEILMNPSLLMDGGAVITKSNITPPQPSQPDYEMGRDETRNASLYLETSSEARPHPPPIVLTSRRREDEKSEMTPLPLLLVRRSDGVGFGIGRSVMAERLGSDTGREGIGSARWGEWCHGSDDRADKAAGLRVVEM